MFSATNRRVAVEIHREWLQGDRLTKKHDLNVRGDALRRLHYLEGKLTRREYYGRDGERISAELFDSEGWLTQSIHGRNHWWYEGGVPYRFESSSSRFFKEGERWVKDQPHGPGHPEVVSPDRMLWVQEAIVQCM